jgi:amidase
MGVYGPLARSVADLQLCLSLLEGPDGRQLEVRPMPISTEKAPMPVQQLRIAMTDRFGDATPSADTHAMLKHIVATLESSGARVEQVEPEIDYDALWQTWGEIATAEITGPMPFLLRNTLRLQLLLSRDRSPARDGMLRGVRLSMRDLARALAFRDEVIRGIDQVLQRFDVWLCPVSSTPAFPHRKPGNPIEADGRQIPYFFATGAYTTPFNLSGHPVVVLPAGWSKRGLPMGVQVVGQRWRDVQLLATVASLDELIGSLRHPPSYEGQEEPAESESDTWSERAVQLSSTD